MAQLFESISSLEVLKMYRLDDTLMPALQHLPHCTALSLVELSHCASLHDTTVSTIVEGGALRHSSITAKPLTLIYPCRMRGIITGIAFQRLCPCYGYVNAGHRSILFSPHGIAGGWLRFHFG